MIGIRVCTELVGLRRWTYEDALQRNLKVMDASAIALARDNDLPIIVFSLKEPGGFAGILQGKGRYSLVKGSSPPAS